MDVFEFDDDEDLKSPPSSPVRKKKIVKAAVAKAAAQDEESSSNHSNTNNNTQACSSTTTDASSTTTPTTSTSTTNANNDNTPSTSASSSTTATSISTGNPLKAGGRTRHARARARLLQEIEKHQQQQHSSTPAAASKVRRLGREEKSGFSPSKHVRFLADQKKLGNPNTYTDDGSGEGGTGILHRTKKRRRRIPTLSSSSSATHNTTKRTTPLEEEDDDDLLSSPRLSTTKTKTTKSLSAQIQQKLQQHERQQQQQITTTGAADSTASPSSSNDRSQHNQQLTSQHQQQQPIVVSVSRKVRGAGRDAFAMQDAGNFQMIHDECAYLTSTIVSGSTSTNKVGTMVESVSELALMLSETKHRRALWGATTRTMRRRGGGNHHHPEVVNTCLEGVLDVLGHATMALSEKFQRSNQQRLLALTQQLELADNQNELENDSSQRISCEQNNSQQHKNIVESYYKGLLLDSLAAILSFLSWDCTIDNKASAYCDDAGGARALRKAILQHEGALSAFLYIIRNADPVVSSILAAHLPEINNNCNSTDASLHSTKTGNPTANDDTSNDLVESQTSDQSTLQQLSHPASSSVASSQNDAGESVASTDPTAAGRRRRRKKRAEAVAVAAGSTLGPIAEDGSATMSFTDGLTNGNTMTNGRSAMSPPTSPPRRVVFQKQEPNSDARTKLSFTSEDAMTMSPPRSPPRRRALGSPSRTSNGGGGDRDDGSSSMVSCDSTLLKIHDHLDKARAQFILPKSEKQSHTYEPQLQHDCQNHRELPLAFGGKDPTGSAAYMAMNALYRLIGGKEEGDAHSCLDETDDASSGLSNSARRRHDGFNEDEDDYHSDGITDEEQSPAAKPPSEDEMLLNNPLLQTNRMLGDAGVIRRLAQGVAETLGAAVLELEEQVDLSGPCQACLHHLHDRFQGLAPIIDNACLLHDDNRADFCLASTDDSEATTGGGVLVGSLLLLLNRWLQQKKAKNKQKNRVVVLHVLNEMGLSALRTLTSLTHENSLAAEQLAVRYMENSNGKVAVPRKGPKTPSSWNGVEVIGQVLHRAATVKKESSGKNAYDTRIFCLNTLANIVGDEPHGDVRRILVEMKVSQAGEGKKGKSTLFLSWLTQWLVGQTESFRDAIMKGSFGGSNQVDGVSSNQHSERELERHENDLLVTAGNGCVLLACLLMDPPHVNKKNNAIALGVSSSPGENDANDPLAAVTQKIRELILSEMPLDDRSGVPSGTTFIRNTLRAFSNFLYYSVGDLSVAVVAPVKHLISQLEKFQVEVIA